MIGLLLRPGNLYLMGSVSEIHHHQPLLFCMEEEKIKSSNSGVMTEILFPIVANRHTWLTPLFMFLLLLMI
jgi:hypothetical protein